MMQFMDTKTCQNLARSFAGESQARTRYALYAAVARQEEQEYLARLFEQAADNELAHAEQFLLALQAHGKQPIENIDLSAGYPFTHGVTMENLFEAAHGEEQEFLEVYPAFAAAARDEGFPDLAALWTKIAFVEGLHRDVSARPTARCRPARSAARASPSSGAAGTGGHIVLSKRALAGLPGSGKKGRGWRRGRYPDAQAPADLTVPSSRQNSKAKFAVAYCPDIA